MKKKIHTHYDNLKISRSAPDEVIRAAYKALSQKYHPDKNPRDDASDVMTIINHSYAVLSDRQQRRKHDHWIAEQEKNAAPLRAQSFKRPRSEPVRKRPPEPQRPKPSTPPPEPLPVQDWQNRSLELTPRKLIVLSFSVLALAALLFFLLHEKPILTTLPTSDEISAARQTASKKKAAMNAIAADSKPSVRHDLSQSDHSPVDVIPGNTANVKFSLGPDGMPWPLGPRLYREDGVRRTGQSTITIDNSHNSHAVNVKVIVDAKSEKMGEMFIPAHRLLALENLPPGVYRLKYRDLQTGSTMQSEPVKLEEIRTDPPAQYGILAITLYASAADNVGFHAIPDDEF